MVAQALACAKFSVLMKRTRISKQPRFRCQIRSHRIQFDISNDLVPFVQRPHPPIVGFVLPESLTSPAEQPTGLLGRDSLHILSDPRRRSLRINQKIDVIRHHHKSDQVVPSTHSIARLDDSSDAKGNVRLLEPVGTTVGGLQFSVGRDEGATIAAGAYRKRAVQPERYEKRCSIRLKVGKVAAVFHVTMVVPIGKRSQILHRLKPVPPMSREVFRSEPGDR
jgi:hypothetical protein